MKTRKAVVAKHEEKFILEKARKYWAIFMSGIISPVNQKESETVFQHLLARYSEPHRAYHNLAHIVAMLDESEFVGKDDWTVALIFAIWFHDAVYDPKAKDNEEQSVEFARRMIGLLGLPSLLTRQVSDLIRATKHLAIPIDHTARVLVDLDLMILGKSEEVFDAYEAEIRAEYAWVPWPDFCISRSKILQSFLDRPKIYSTELFRNKYENTARKNLIRSIASLRS